MRRKFLSFFLTIIGLIVGSGGVMAAYTPTLATETIMLTKANVDAQDYLSATDNWATNKNYGASLDVPSGDYLNMSKAERTISITVSGVESFKVAVYDTNGSRDWTVSVGSKTSTQTTDKSGLQWTDALETGNTGEVTITLAGAGSSVYPVAIMISKPETSAPEFTTNLPASATVNPNVAKEFQVAATGNTNYQWYINSANSTTGAQKIEGATSSKYSYTATSIGTEYIYCVATNKIGSTTSTICAVSTSLSAECKLISVQFTNSAYGTIAEGQDAVGTKGEDGYVPAVPATVTVPIIAGTDAPGVNLLSFEYSKNASCVTDGAKIRVTAEDGKTYNDYAIVYKHVTPLEVSADIETTAFTEVPEWVYNPYGYDATKGVKFAKAVNEDSNMRITKGNTRQYYFIAPAKTLTLTSATSSRNINIYVNGEKLSTPTASGAADETIKIALDSENPNMVCIESNQTGGDGGFKAYAITANEQQTTDPEGEEPGGDDIDPSTAKLLWDYTEAAPSSNPDNGLYYAANVNDKAGTNNGLKGIKLNSSGYAYFTKAAVKGTLKLTYGPRSGTSKSSLGIYSFTQDGETVTKGEKIAVTKEVTECSTDEIELTAEQNNIYIARETTNEQVLTKIEFVPFVPRTFVDFKINFTKSWASSSTITEGTTYYVTATDDDGVPTYSSEVPADGKYLCTFKGRYHGTAYGITGNLEFKVPVDGSVKVYYGMNDYGADITVKNQAGETVLTGNSKGDKFSSDPKNVMSMTYAKDADVLTFTGGGYVPYFAVEACEVAPCTVTFKDQDGKEISKVDTFEGEALGELPSADLITVPEGSAFRGWFYASGAKAKATDALNGNTTVTAKVTPIETVEAGTVQNYNLESAIFYPEDHETISIEGGSYYNNHGWNMAANGTISVNVAGNAQVILKLCQYGNGTTITVTDGNGNVVAENIPAKADSDGSNYSFNYSGEATTLTLTFAAQSYIHAVSVYNVNDFVEKDAETGWYIVPEGDAAALILAINSANSEEGATIFLPNGTYDLGNTVLTTISGKNMSIIGESMEGTIIKTTALEEKLGVADLFYNTSTGLYMQDLTLQNDFDYYNSGSAGRAAVLQDNGNQTIMRNVAFRSYQDTYYSKQGNYYFEGGLIQGTVDYICGGGNAWFEDITLLNKSRSASGNTGDDTMTAYNGNGMYIFNNCSVESECATFNFGRSWETAYVVYLNTTIKSGKLIDTRFSTNDMNKTAPRFFGEYNTVDESGNGKNTPASNHLKTSNGGDFESVLTEAQAAEYTLENMFGAWDPKTIAAQVEEMPESTDGLVYLVDGKVTTVCPESGTVRIANSRGGFGPEIEVGTTDAINDINVENAVSANGKFLSNGRVIIRKDGKTYSTVGLEVK